MRSFILPIQLLVNHINQLEFRTVAERYPYHPPTRLKEGIKAEILRPLAKHPTKLSSRVDPLKYAPNLLLLEQTGVFPSAGSWAQRYSD